MIQKRLSVRGWPSGTAADSEDTVKFAQASGVECQIETYVQLLPLLASLPLSPRADGLSFARSYPLEKIQDAYDSMMNGKARCVPPLSLPRRPPRRRALTPRRPRSHSFRAVIKMD